MGRPRCCAKGDDNRPNRVVHLNDRASNEEEEDYPRTAALHGDADWGAVAGWVGSGAN